MAFGDGAGTRIAYIAESTFGTTPATPAFQVLRTTGGGVSTNKTTAISDELQADRNVRDEIQLGQDVAGSYPFELSYGSFDDILAAVMFGDWAANILKNGTTRKFFTFEETVELGATDSFSRYVGAMISQMSLNFTARGKITGSFNVMAKQEQLDAAIIFGATYTAANTNAVMSASGSLGSLSVLGGSYKVRSLTLNINNNLRTRPVIGSLYSEEFGAGRTTITGEMEIYFESNTLYQSVLDHGSGAVSFTVGQVANEKYTFDLPKIILGSGSKPVGGNDDDIMVRLPYTAVYDASEACSLKITRAVA